jgi:predicted TIM-barrel fold metal-dependent hydrolase
MSMRFVFIKAITMVLMAMMIACSSPVAYYSVSDFQSTPKIDAHFHYLTMDDEYIRFAVSENFRILDPIWEGVVPITAQFTVAESISRSYPSNFVFFDTFPTDSFNTSGFAEQTINHIKNSIKAGASGIKIWKNIGMVLKDRNGHYVMITDPAFTPILTYLEANKIPVMAHLGEPRDCWLPLDKMIDPGAVVYFRENPQYYMFLHHEAPSYDDQINARDSILGQYPNLDFIGAHLASLEWSVDELAKRLDKYPNLVVDMAARMTPIQIQAKADREKVRDFMIKYQDRILYGTDFEVHDAPGINPDSVIAHLHKGWLDQWIFMATDSTIGVKGLKLPKDVIDKIYFKNAGHYFRKD